MKEFMLLIYNRGKTTPKRFAEFIMGCESYIKDLKKNKSLIAAQPLEYTGKMISGKPLKWKEASVAADNKAWMQVGYYHIRAKDMRAAVSIAKKNPEFAYKEARIEVRPIKVKEEKTGFVYPKEG